MEEIIIFMKDIKSTSSEFSEAYADIGILINPITSIKVNYITQRIFELHPEEFEIVIETFMKDDFYAGLLIHICRKYYKKFNYIFSDNLVSKIDNIMSSFQKFLKYEEVTSSESYYIFPKFRSKKVEDIIFNSNPDKFPDILLYMDKNNLINYDDLDDFVKRNASSSNKKHIDNIWKLMEIYYPSVDIQNYLKSFPDRTFASLIMEHIKSTTRLDFMFRYTNMMAHDDVRNYFDKIDVAELSSYLFTRSKNFDETYKISIYMSPSKINELKDKFDIITYMRDNFQNPEFYDVNEIPIEILYEKARLQNLTDYLDINRLIELISYIVMWKDENFLFDDMFVIRFTTPNIYDEIVLDINFAKKMMFGKDNNFGRLFEVFDISDINSIFNSMSYDLRSNFIARMIYEVEDHRIIDFMTQMEETQIIKYLSYINSVVLTKFASDLLERKTFTRIIMKNNTQFFLRCLSKTLSNILRVTIKFDKSRKGDIIMTYVY